jgi:hypothetical protein
MDGPKLRINSKEKANELLEKLSLNGKMQEGMGLPAIFEEVATYQAVAVLCPDEAIDHFHSNGMQVHDVAKALDIPPIYAAMAMQEDWLEWREKIINFSE